VAWRAIAFGVVTVGLAAISRLSLRRPGSHGFFRFFAWEAITALFLLNVGYWFHDPLAWNQLIAWALLTISCVPVVWGAVLLHRRGKPSDQRASAEGMLAFEKTTQLVTSGIYASIRHPLYSSLLLLTWGIFCKHISLHGALFAVASTLFLILTARADEAECVAFFGPEYEAYMRRTRRFIPFLF
jgi:protein-S-isoprenylcysteine O-methyltransferase Ste14